MNSIKQLENSGVLQILLFLHERGKTKVTDIDVDASSGTVYRALNTLAKLELIDEERIRPYTRKMGRNQRTGNLEARHGRYGLRVSGLLQNR